MTIFLDDILRSCSPDPKDYFEVVYRIRQMEPETYPTDKAAYIALEEKRMELGLKERYSSVESFYVVRARIIRKK